MARGDFRSINVAPDGQDHASAPTGAVTSKRPGVDQVPSAQSTMPPAQSPDAATVAACRARIAAAEQLVAAARPGVQNWSEHIRARASLLAGRTTRTEATQVWTRTRLAGPRDIQRFEAAVLVFNRHSRANSQCGVAGDANRLTAACRTRADRAVREVGAVRRVMDDWEHHLHDMAALRRGDVDASVAQARWEQAWRTGLANLDALRRAEAAVRSAPACPPPS